MSTLLLAAKIVIIDCVARSLANCVRSCVKHNATCVREARKKSTVFFRKPSASQRAIYNLVGTPSIIAFAPIVCVSSRPFIIGSSLSVGVVLRSDRVFQGSLSSHSTTTVTSLRGDRSERTDRRKKRRFMSTTSPTHMSFCQH